MAAAAVERPMDAVTESAVRLTAVMSLVIAAAMMEPAVPATATMTVRQRVMSVRKHFVLRISRVTREIKLTAPAVMTDYFAQIRARAPVAAAAAGRLMRAVMASAVRSTAVTSPMIVAVMTGPAVPATATMTARRQVMNVRKLIVRRIERAMCAIVPMAPAAMIVYSA